MQQKILYILIILCGIATLVSGYSLVESEKVHKVESESTTTIEQQHITEQKSDEIKNSNTTYHLPLTTQTEKSTTSPPGPNTTSINSHPKEKETETNVSLKINGNTFTIPYIEKMTAEDTMKYAHETYPQQFWYESIAYGSDLGTFVTSINGTAENYKEKMHWILYINGKKSNKGISTLTLNPNDTITWNYEKEIL